MGLLGKYAAYRWLSNSDDGGGGGDGDVGLVLLIVGAVMGAIILVGLVLKFLGEFLYNIIRPILMISPFLSAILSSLLISSLLLLVARYPPETAKTILYHENSDDNPRSFYTSAVLVVGLILGVLTHVVRTEGDPIMDFTWAGEWIGIPLTLIMNLAFGIAFFYALYKLFQLPYRYHRLMQYAPSGRVYTIVMVFPLALMIVISLFNLPTPTITLLGIDVIGGGLIASVILLTYIAPIAIIRYRAEAHIITEATKKTV